MATEELIKKRLATVASAEAHRASWEEGMEIDLIDDGIEPPIPTDQNKGAILFVNANGSYQLLDPPTGTGSYVLKFVDGLPTWVLEQSQ